MRFSRLSLERYGRFEDCHLDFRTGGPDLHIIYGPNEAGKTTSLAAVSDLLFGFPTRSPYNFLYDYSLLRVGAVLEDGERTLACRRKKGSSGTLLDAADVAIDDAPLLAMLKGQKRETFALSFSLDQDALRQGGRAMVEAKNDVGRTLFAAGSGLVGVTDELRRLEAEAEGIWGPSTKASRTFTQAQRLHADAVRTVRDHALKPKAWQDAKAAAEQTRGALDAARQARERVQGELRTAERLRRLAPLVRERDEQAELLKTFEGVPELGRQREDAAEALIREADEAARQAAAAELLREDVVDRRSKIAGEPGILEDAEEIDRLVAASGADLKAAQDLVALEEERRAVATTIARLRAEAGANADAAPPRATVARLRDLARGHGEHQAAIRQIAQSRDGIEQRRDRARAVLDATREDAGSEALLHAVDAARALGADADDRVDAAHRKAQAAGATLRIAIERLAPWVGGIEDLMRLPLVGEREIDGGRDSLAAVAKEIRSQDEEAQRSTDLAAAVALEIAQTGTGGAVSPEEVLEARRLREERWRPIRNHVLNGGPLPDPIGAVGQFEAGVAHGDETMDRRFHLAEASSRLTLREQARASHELVASQASARAADARKRHGEALAAWSARLTEAGLPSMEPARLSAWQSDRILAEKAHAEHQELLGDAARAAAKRDGALRLLMAALSSDDEGASLAPLLLTAERRRTALEEARQSRRVAQSELDQVALDTAGLNGRQQKLNAEIEADAHEWKAVLAETGLDLEAVTCGTVLDLLGELREAVAAESLLVRRIEGITRDARDHALSLGEVAGRLGLPADDTAAQLRTCKARLESARTADTLLRSLDEEDRRRGAEVGEALARLKVAEDALAPFLAETGSRDRTALSASIERSRSVRALRDAVAATERRIVADGDGLTLDELLVAVTASDPDQIGEHLSRLAADLQQLNADADDAATRHGDARSTFAALDTEGTSAIDAAADAEQARSELEVLAEHYILKRSQAVMLKWAIEKYRERHQDPLLLRAGQLFSTLTTGRYASLRIDADGATPRLLGLRDDLRTIVEVDAMSEGTADQLFLALRLASLEQSVAAGIRLPFLADDLFVNFDDHRAEAGFQVLAEVAKSTQVLFFTHHPHLVEIARSVVGAQHHSECALT